MDQSLLKIIAENTALYEALVAFFLKEFDLNQIEEKDLKMSNEGLGEVVRGSVTAKILMLGAMDKIARLKTSQSTHSTVNPGR
jgi:Na+/H+ antiporter NhaC